MLYCYMIFAQINLTSYTQLKTGQKQLHEQNSKQKYGAKREHPKSFNLLHHIHTTIHFQIFTVSG